MARVSGSARSTPTGHRVSAVMPDWATRNTYFSHSIRRGSAASSAGIPAPPQAARNARTRSDSFPLISPKRSRPRSPWLITPGASMVANTSAIPAITWPGPRMAASLSSLSTPFWMESTPVSGPTTGRMTSAAASVSNDFTQKSTRSAGGASSRRSTAGARTVNSPSRTDFTRSPPAWMARRCSPRATKVTSSPARASLAPKKPPVPPLPMITIRIRATPRA